MFYVVESNAPPLISLQSVVDLGLVQMKCAIESSFNCASPCIDKQLIEKEYGDLFKGIGVLPREVKLYLKDDAVPVVNPPRRVPEAIISKLKAELDTMESDQIIAKVTESTNWVSSLVAVEKTPKNWQAKDLLGSKSAKRGNSQATLPHVHLGRCYF